MDIQEISINHDIHLARGGKHFEKKKMVVASIYTHTKPECFRGYTGVSLSVRPSIHPSMSPSVYKILVSVKALAGLLNRISDSSSPFDVFSVPKMFSRGFFPMTESILSGIVTLMY